jgi:uncharacterized hydantoinase/oxoprolinase family protein
MKQKSIFLGSLHTPLFLMADLSMVMLIGLPMANLTFAITALTNIYLGVLTNSQSYGMETSRGKPKI